MKSKTNSIKKKKRNKLWIPNIKYHIVLKDKIEIKKIKKPQKITQVNWG
jgi:hypothetical protein